MENNNDRRTSFCLVDSLTAAAVTADHDLVLETGKAATMARMADPASTRRRYPDVAASTTSALEQHASYHHAPRNHDKARLD